MSTRLALFLALLLLAGCDDAVAPAARPKAAPAPTAAKPREILGKRTQDIKDDAAERKTAGATTPAPRPIAKDPITLAGNTYVTAIGQTAINNIKHALDLYQASEGQYPQSHQEFMDKIIKANNMALPTLPYYQEYSYDVATHQLRIIEYPDRKAAGNAR